MSTPWIVHQYDLSPNAERLRRVLVRLDLPFEIRSYVPFSAEGQAEVKDLVARSGHNQIPVLERDGAYFGDSLAITAMLVEEYPDRAELLYPGGPGQVAAAHAFVLAGDSGFFRPAGKFLTAEFQERKGADHAAKILAFGEQRRDGVLHAWDAALATQPFLLGEAYSMADIGVAPYLNATIQLPKLIHAMAAQGTKLPFDPEQWPEWDVNGATYPHLRGWLDRCNAAEYTDSRVAAA